MKIISYVIFRIALAIFSIMPFWLMYSISNVLAFLLYRVIAYRKNLVTKNVSQIFSDRSEDEKKAIIKKSYANLADIIVEGLKGLTMTEEQVKSRYKFLNPEILDECYETGRSVILVAGHYNNWEWAAVGAPFFFKHITVGLYKKMSNKYVNNFFLNSRGNTGMILAELRETAEAFEEYTSRNEPSLFFLAADQSPSNTKKAYWTEFLGRPTACLHGPGNYAVKYDLPVVFCSVERIKRGRYELTLSWVSKCSSEHSEGEIVAKFMKRLEKDIDQDPGNWLWSHNRWKHRHQGQELIHSPSVEHKT